MSAPALALLHGYLGFRNHGPIHCFRGVAPALQRHLGAAPIVTEVPSTGPLAQRAAALASQLFASEAEAFALVAHSMGGLDARYVISHLDPDRRIKSLVTVATPHRGSALADWMIASSSPLAALIRSMDRGGLYDLTPSVRAEQEIPDRDDVAYASYAGFRPHEEMPWPVRYLARRIPEDSDGQVELTSAHWGEFRGTIRADHLEQIGWGIGLPDRCMERPFDHVGFWCRTGSEAIEMARV